MKKFTVTALAAVAAVMMYASCDNGAPKASLKSDVDTVSYAIGMAQTQGLKDYLVGRLGVDTTYMDEFIKGLNEGANAGDDKKKAAYYAGIQIGQQISNQMVKGINHELFGDDSTKTISLKNFMAGFISGTTGKGGLMTPDSAAQVAQQLMRTIKAKNMEKEFGPNKKAGEDFLKENAKKQDVKTLKSGVQYKVIKEGTGALPKDTSLVKVHYEGKTLDGKVFDSSYKRNEPTEFRANQVIKGWTDALLHMPAGSIWEVYIPQELAYGERQQGADIKPFSMLIFKIELLEVDGIFQEQTRSLHGVMVSVTRVKISPDLSICTAYLSIFPSEKGEELIKNITKNEKQIRYELGTRVRYQLRIIPELRFFIDDSLDYMERIDELLKK